MRNVNVALLAALFVTPVAASAQTGPTPVAATGKESKDPNRMVCRTVDTTGSRLGRKKECHTAAEWAEQQLLDRQTVERSQANRYKGNN